MLAQKRGGWPHPPQRHGLWQAARNSIVCLKQEGHDFRPAASWLKMYPRFSACGLLACPGVYAADLSRALTCGRVSRNSAPAWADNRSVNAEIAVIIATSFNWTSCSGGGSGSVSSIFTQSASTAHRGECSSIGMLSSPFRSICANPQTWGQTSLCRIVRDSQRTLRGGENRGRLFYQCRQIF